MKKQLLALAGAVTLGFGVGNWGPTTGQEATSQALVGYLVARKAHAVVQNVSSSTFGAAGAVGGRQFQLRAASPPAMRTGVQVAARAAFARRGALMGARIGAGFGVAAGLPGILIGTAAGAL